MSVKNFRSSNFFCLFHVFLFAGLLSACSPSGPVYEGEFNWKRWNIQNRIDCDATDCAVYASLDASKRKYALESNDQCYFLDGDQWLFREPKDPGIWLRPVFCVGKGGGWGYFPAE